MSCQSKNTDDMFWTELIIPAVDINTCLDCLPNLTENAVLKNVEIPNGMCGEGSGGGGGAFRQWQIYVVKFWMRTTGSKFFPFHAVFGVNLAKFHVGAPGGLTPPPRGNSGSTTC